MGLIEKLKSVIGCRASEHDQSALMLENWYAVRWDEESIYRSVSPPGRTHWEDSLRWRDIIRVCFKAEGLEASDGIYLYTKERPESYSIPTEAKGGVELWQEVIRRGLFDPSLAIEAATAEYGLFCWPSVEQGSEPALEPDA